MDYSLLLPFLNILITKNVIIINFSYSMNHLYCIFFVKIVYYCTIHLYQILGPHGRLVPLFAKCCYPL